MSDRILSIMKFYLQLELMSDRRDKLLSLISVIKVFVIIDRSLTLILFYLNLSLSISIINRLHYKYKSINNRSLSMSGNIRDRSITMMVHFLKTCFYEFFAY